MNHIRKGCLTRTRQDISTDGSRIEGSHKGWNSLQRSQPSGIEVFSALVHDFVLCCNLCVANLHGHNVSDFALATLVSHLVRLCHHIACLFNKLFDQQKNYIKDPVCKPQPSLMHVNSGET